MRKLVFIVVAIGVLAGSGPSKAAQPAVQTPAQPIAHPPAQPPVTPVVELDQLVALGKSVAAIRYASDNAFVYAARVKGLRETAQALEGGRVEFAARVMRVTGTEVFVEVVPAGKTRLVLRHAALPEIGNLRTVTYAGPSSTRRLHNFSAPLGLRIGSEINLDMAKTLRRRDTLVMRGTIAKLPVWIESVFVPDAVALISDWSVLKVNPQTRY